MRAMQERAHPSTVSPAPRPEGIFRRVSRSRAFRTLLLTAAAFAGGAVSAELARARTERQSPYAMMDQLARVLVWIENEYVDPVDRARLVEGGIKGMVAELDPHS